MLNSEENIKIRNQIVSNSINKNNNHNLVAYMQSLSCLWHSTCPSHVYGVLRVQDPSHVLVVYMVSRPSRVYGVLHVLVVYMASPSCIRHSSHVYGAADIMYMESCVSLSCIWCSNSVYNLTVMYMAS